MRNDERRIKTVVCVTGTERRVHTVLFLTLNTGEKKKQYTEHKRAYNQTSQPASQSSQTIVCKAPSYHCVKEALCITFTKNKHKTQTQIKWETHIRPMALRTGCVEFHQCIRINNT